MGIYRNVLEMVGNTPLLAVHNIDTGPCELFLKLELMNPGGSIKDRIGISMIEEAERRGDLKPGATLVNVSRGELVDEDAVAAALDVGHLGALAMDVGRAADQRPSAELASRPGVVATPHLGGLTPENADAQAMSSVEQVGAILARSMPPRAVNPDHATRLRDWWER